MRESTREAASKVLGAIAGGITGIGASFIPGHYYILEHGGGSAADGFWYLASLPFFTLWHIGKGAAEGANKGLMAGLIYPKTLNDSFQTEKHNNELFVCLTKYLAAFKSSPPSSVLLTEKEEQNFQNMMKQEQISSEKRE